MNATTYQFLILIVLNLSILLFIRFKKIHKKENIVRISSDQFITVIRVFDQIILTYKNVYYDKEFQKLEYKYDLKQDSSTNSIEQFATAKNQLIIKTAKDILENFISTDVRNSLSIYFNDDFLILLIIEKLKE